MRYLVEYENGEIISSVETDWRKLPRDKKIVSMGIYDFDENYHEISGYDIWFFSDEAVVSVQTQNNKWVARYIGGFKKDGIGEVIKVKFDGVEKSKIFFEKWSKIFNCEAFIFNKGE